MKVEELRNPSVSNHLHLPRALTHADTFVISIAFLEKGERALVLLKMPCSPARDRPFPVIWSGPVQVRFLLFQLGLFQSVLCF